MLLKLYTYSVLILLLFHSTVTSAQCDNSKLWFNYGGYSDTTVATLFLNVTLCDAEEKEVLDSSYVSLSILNEEGDVKNDSILVGETKGISFYHGVYTLNLSFNGYQPTAIINYKAIPDQFSRGQVILGKNDELIELNTNPYVHVPKNGNDTSFHDNGAIKSVLTYLNDAIVKSIFYYANGNVHSKYEAYTDSLFSTISFYPNGKIEFVTTWNKGLTIGFRKDYYENGKLKQELLNTSKGQLNWTQIDSNGIVFVKNGNSDKRYWRGKEKPTIFGYYKNGRKHGLWIWLNNGQVFKRYRYKNGVLVLYEFYNSDGELYRKSTYNKEGKEKKTTYKTE